MKRTFVDSNIFIYALGDLHPRREQCRRIVDRLARGELKGEISIEVVQEVVHVRRRRRGALGDATRKAREILSWKLPLHSVERADLDLALGLIDDYPALSTRDALHAATALNRGIDLILSADGSFNRVEGLERTDPGDSGLR